MAVSICVRLDAKLHCFSDQNQIAINRTSLASHNEKESLVSRPTPNSDSFFPVRPTVVAAAVACVFFLAPTFVRASCGDYALSHANVANLPSNGQREPHQRVLPAHADQHAPCSGPSCRSQPVQFPTAPVPPQPNVKEWVATFNLWLGSNDRCTNLIAATFTLYNFYHTFPPEHPPRAF
jgi:hypothetical protein